MVGFVVFLHVLACLLIVCIVLLQTGKGSEIGAVFGTSSGSVFGPTGPTNILSKITIASAVVFICTSLFLTYSFSKKSSVDSIMPSSKSTAPVNTDTQKQAPLKTAPAVPTQEQPAKK